MKQIIRLANPKNPPPQKDYREVVEERKLLTRDGPQDSNTTEDDGNDEKNENDENDE